MKTPREILLERHQQANPKLDAIRKAIWAAECQPETRSLKTEIRSANALPLKIVFIVWRELIWPARRIWAGLAATWVLILLVNLDLMAGMARMTAASSPRSSDFIMALREQKQMIAELTEPPTPNLAEPPKPFIPQPRSERHGELFAI
jgi:hypothetical protein